ncbi:molybdopterin converting factor subunit 1 [Microbulbifer hainanensis]|uniref:molybdopterin converting factor subunit 1 n=1 Tax=Microbulbifer hainanensis TaxID=2735675 RepID=UPI001868391D|nr:molybdopterin converting factor subunit 1 [Microbulbifer hainanensis]
MIRVLFFAGLREQLGCADVSVPAGSGTTLAGLRAQLGERDATWQRALADENVQMALNRQMAKSDSIVRDGDEVAFFPPVTGG